MKCGLIPQVFVDNINVLIQELQRENYVLSNQFSPTTRFEAKLPVFDRIDDLCFLLSVQHGLILIDMRRSIAEFSFLISDLAFHTSYEWYLVLHGAVSILHEGI